MHGLSELTVVQVGFSLKFFSPERIQPRREFLLFLCKLAWHVLSYTRRGVVFALATCVDALCSQKYISSLYLHSYVLGIEISLCWALRSARLFSIRTSPSDKKLWSFQTFVASLMSVDAKVVVGDIVLTEIIYNVFSETFTLVQRYRDFIRKILEAESMC